MKPSLLVTIDTEEEGLWNNRFQSEGNTVRNLRGVPRFQQLCEEYSVRPTYFVDSPVVEDEYGAELFRELDRSGRAEIGTHLHPWCTRPFEEELTPRNSYLCNLPESLQRAKLVTITDQIAEAIGRRPTSFRAGRYGLGGFAARTLVELGYTVDSSVIPFTDYRRQEGPDFSAAPWRRYRMAAGAILQADDQGPLVELPVGIGFSRGDFDSNWKWRRRLSTAPLSRFRLVGLLDRLDLIRKIKLSPEQASAADMCRLIDQAILQGSDCLVLMFHSSSLVPGMSPYVADERALEEFHGRLRTVFTHCRSRHNLDFPGMTEFARGC